MSNILHVYRKNEAEEISKWNSVSVKTGKDGERNK